jgi:endoglucanase
MKITKKENWKSPSIGNPQIKLLEKLSNTISVSGDEREIRKIIIERIEDLVDEYKIDHLGNILAIKKGKGRNRIRVMLAAHMDEVGFMITHAEKKGLYKFEIVGGIDERNLVGKPVIVGNDQKSGVIGAKAIHLTTAQERKSPIKTSALRIDLGPANGEKIKPGTLATFATKLKRVGPSILGKAIDDRIGVATIISILENQPENVDILAAFTVQEELGLRGARVAAYSMEPDIGIALDSTPSMDMPTFDGSENTLYRTKLGQGPAVYPFDGATIADPRLLDLFTSVGDEYKIPYQLRQPAGGGTDAGSIHKQRGGIPSISISVPGRYAHSSATLVRLDDWKNTVRLVHATLSHMNKNLLTKDRR